ncbi:MAG: Spy/CpxP family protein refolding chaperone [Acidobacteria bacterium]|nr:Spy/CpxP family protein refolding chaperone [Acidobacteriota bacterium]
MKLINSGRLGAAYMFALFLLLLISSPAQVFAQDEQGVPTSRMDGPRPNPDGDLVRQLNLTPEQIEKIRTIREGNRELRRQVGQRIRAARVALDRAIYVENADEAVIEQRARELAEAQGAQIRLQAMAELGVRRILTPEQLQTFQDLRLRAERNRRNRRFQNNAERDGGPNAPNPADAGGRPLRQRRPRPSP